MMRALLARNVALRGLAPWLLIMLVGAQVITGVYGLIVYKTGHMTYTPLLIGVWVMLAIYLTWGKAKHRCSRFDMALPIEARDLWSASLVGSVVSAIIMLTVALGVVVAVFALTESPEELETLHSGNLLRVGTILLAGVCCGVACVQSRRLDLASASGGLWTSFGVFGGLMLLLAPMIWLQGRPVLLVALLLAGTVALVYSSRSRFTAGYVLSPLEPERKKSVRTIDRTDKGAVARPARGLRAVWLHYMLLVRSAPKGPQLLLVATPFLMLFGALLSGLLQKLMPNSDLRFAYLPITAYMALAAVGPVMANLRMVGALPLGRRYLLLLITVPPLLLITAGYLGGVVWLGAKDFEMPTLAFHDEDKDYGLRVPTFMWRMAWDGEVSPTVSPLGESHPAMTIPIIKGATPAIYKPYTTPVGSSREYVAWQIWRAAQALHGTRLTPEEIADRFLWTDSEGRVRLKDETLVLRDGVGVVVEKSPGPFFPMTLALVGLLLYVGIAVYAPGVRAGVTKLRRNMRLWILLGVLLLIHWHRICWPLPGSPVPGCSKRPAWI